MWRYGRPVRAFSPLLAASLLVGVLSTWESATYKAVHPDWQWHSLANRLAGAQADALNLLWWAKTKDGEKNRNRPKSVFPDSGKSSRMKDAVMMPVDELRAYLARPRK